MDDKRPQRARRSDSQAARVPRPLDEPGLQALALHYAARYATTTLKLRRYLERKLKERSWAGELPPDVEGLVRKLSGLGYVDDEVWAAARTRDMAARGLGRRRIAQTLAAAGIVGAQEEVLENPFEAAVRFARRRRLGPFARETRLDAAVVERRALAAMLRAGHDFEVARRVLAARSEAEAMALD
jgi:regulatory protein